MKTLDEESLRSHRCTDAKPLSRSFPSFLARNVPLTICPSAASMKINGHSHATEAKVVAAVIGPDDSLKFLRAYASPTTVTFANRFHLIRYPV